ncbi:hypothetical protein ACFL3S_05185 [Gemmatimonadota bacterium]
MIGHARSHLRVAAVLSSACLFLLQAPQPVLGQVRTEEPDTLRHQLEVLKQRLDSLEALIGRLQEPEARVPIAPEDPLAALRAAAQAAAAEADTLGGAPEEGEPQFVGRQRSLQALNPEISVGGDLFAQMDPEHSNHGSFFARELQISFVASLDPFSRGKLFLARGASGGGVVPFGDSLVTTGFEKRAGEAEGGFELEEGYVEWVNLPGGAALSLGQFRQRLGTLNRWHDHALPFQNRPLPHIAFVDGELLQTGASLYFLLPVTSFGTWQAWLEVTRSDNAFLFGYSKKPSYLAHLNGFWQVTEALDLDLGFSGSFGPYESDALRYDQRLFSLEGALTWKPPGQSLYRGGVLRFGALLKDPGEASRGTPPGQALGYWAMGELTLSQQWLVGGQVGWVENPDNPEETAWMTGPALTWWQSEFVRIRAEYDLFHGTETKSQFLIQVTFAMGPHKHEAY